MRITEMLEQLSLATGLLTLADAERVAKAVNTRVRALIGADLVKMYWKAGAERGCMLTPFGVDNVSSLPDPQPFYADETYRGGILCWVLKYRKPLWLSKMQELDLQEPAQNLLGRDETIGVEFLSELAHSPFDSIVAVPLLSRRNELIGIYTVEFTDPPEISKELIEALKRLGKGLARLYWEADMTESTLGNTHQALNHFLETLSDDDIEGELVPPSGFIARPFSGDSFADLERRLRSLLQGKGISVRSYKPHGRHTLVVNEIANQIKRSHFGIADITDSNPNVMAEVGMMMALSKRVLLVRKKDEQSTGIPFDVAGYDVHEYQLVPRSSDIEIWSPNNGSWEPFQATLDDFVVSLNIAPARGQ